MAAFDYVSSGITALSGLNALINGPDEARRNMKYQSDLAFSNWRAQQEYNSPVNQRKRLMEAGVNPNVAFQGVQTTAGNAPAPPETAPFGNIQPSSVYSSQMLSSTAQSIAALAQASKSQSENKSIQTLLAGQIKQLNLENVGQDIQNQLNDFQLRLNRAYGHRKMSAETETAVSNYFRTLQELQNAGKTGKILDEQVYQAGVDSLIKDLEKLGKDTEIKMLQETAKQLPARLAAEINEINQRADAANAAAESSRASAESTRKATEFEEKVRPIREKLLQNQDTREVLENGSLSNEVLQALSDYDWNLEMVEQSKDVRPIVKKFVGFIRVIARQSTLPVTDILRGILKK